MLSKLFMVMEKYLWRDSFSCLILNQEDIKKQGKHLIYNESVFSMSGDSVECKTIQCCECFIQSGQDSDSIYVSFSICLYNSQCFKQVCYYYFKQVCYYYFYLWLLLLLFVVIHVIIKYKNR